MSGVSFRLNGRNVVSASPAVTRLSNVLRDEFRATGTKSGCDAGDCGACTVQIDGELACACLVPVAEAEGRSVVTVEGLAANTSTGQALQDSFLAQGAAQCGICTPGMLVAAARLLDHERAPSRARIADAMSGVLCRCTGYSKIIDAIVGVASAPCTVATPKAGKAVGARIARLDGHPKVAGQEAYGADAIPPDALFVRAIRSPYHRARFSFGDLDAFLAASPGIIRVLTAADIPGRNIFGVIPPFADQPVFATGETRFRGEAVAAIVGELQRHLGLRRGQLSDRLDRKAGRPHPGAGGRSFGRSDPREPTRQYPGARPCDPRRHGHSHRRGRGGGGRRVLDRVRRARLYRTRGGLGPAREGPHRGDRLDAIALSGPRRYRRHSRNRA